MPSGVVATFIGLQQPTKSAGSCMPNLPNLPTGVPSSAHEVTWWRPESVARTTPAASTLTSSLPFGSMKVFVLPWSPMRFRCRPDASKRRMIRADASATRMSAPCTAMALTFGGFAASPNAKPPARPPPPRTRRLAPPRRRRSCGPRRPSGIRHRRSARHCRTRLSAGREHADVAVAEGDRPGRTPSTATSSSDSRNAERALPPMVAASVYSRSSRTGVPAPLPERWTSSRSDGTDPPAGFAGAGAWALGSGRTRSAAATSVATPPIDGGGREPGLEEPLAQRQLRRVVGVRRFHGQPLTRRGARGLLRAR